MNNPEAYKYTMTAHKCAHLCLKTHYLNSIDVVSSVRGGSSKSDLVMKEHLYFQPFHFSQKNSNVRPFQKISNTSNLKDQTLTPEAGM